MTDTAIVGGNVEVIQTAVSPRSSPFSWSAAIAGAFAAVAVTFIIISLGSGIGLALSSPYRSSPSLTALTVAGAIWLVMAQAFGFACGGYLAARLRNRFADVLTDETTFRDAAQGFMVWALAVVANLAVVAAAAGLTGLAGATLGAGVAARTGAAPAGQLDIVRPAPVPIAYFVDTLFRTPNATTTGQGGQASLSPAAPGQTQSGTAEARAEAQRILTMSLVQGRFDDADRDHLAQLVAQRTGLSQEEAKRRVEQVAAQMKQAADKAAKAGAFASFWAFMSLLIGATAATLAGIVGGELRDRPERAVR